jgi:hypothetical protein
VDILALAVTHEGELALIEPMLVLVDNVTGRVRVTL